MSFLLNKKTWNWLKWVLLFVVIYKGYSNFINNSNTFGTDLRNRITGARTLETTNNIYTYKWENGDPEELCDPYDHPNDPMNRVTASPFAIQFHQLFSFLPYQKIRYLWFFMQYALYIVIILLIYFNIKSEEHKRISLFLGGLLSTFPFWSFHVERGQMYILTAFILTATIIFWRKQNLNYYFISLAFLVLLRPTFCILLTIPLILGRRELILKQIYFCLPVLVGHFFLFNDIYVNYLQSMSLMGDLQIAKLPISGREDFINYPVIIEEMDWSSIGVFNFENTSIQHLFLEYLNFKIAPSLLKTIFIVITLLVLIFSYVKKLTGNTLVLFLSVFIIIGEYFIPAPRYSYNFTQVIPLLILAYPLINKNFQTILISISLLLLSGLLSFVSYDLGLGELLLLTLLITLTINYETNKELSTDN